MQYKQRRTKLKLDGKHFDSHSMKFFVALFEERLGFQNSAKNLIEKISYSHMPEKKWGSVGWW